MPGIRLHSWPSSFSCPTTSNHQNTVPCCFAALLPNNKPSSDHCAVLLCCPTTNPHRNTAHCCPTTSPHQITGHCCFAAQQQAFIRLLGTVALLPNNKPSSDYWALLLCCPTTSPHQNTGHCCFAAQQALIRTLGTAALLPNNKPSSDHRALLLCCPTTSPHQTTVPYSVTTDTSAS